MSVGIYLFNLKTVSDILDHPVPVNRICVVMSSLEMDVGKSHEIAFSMTVQRDFQRQSLKS